MFDGKVVSLQGVRLQRVPEDDRGIVVLILEGEELLRADGMEGLVGLCNEAGLGELRGRDTLGMLDTVAWKHRACAIGERRDEYRKQAVPPHLQGLRNVKQADYLWECKKNILSEKGLGFQPCSTTQEPWPLTRHFPFLT